MINLMPGPGHVPSLRLMLDDIGNPSPDMLALKLGVSVRSVQRWLKRGDAPHPAKLALFWLTRWGMSSVNCDAYNTALVHRQRANGLQLRVTELEDKLARLARIADFGTANDPSRDLQSVAPPPAIVTPRATKSQPESPAQPDRDTRRSHYRTTRGRHAR